MSGLHLVAHSDLGGCRDGMQVLRHGDALYVGHTGTSGAGTSILDGSATPEGFADRIWGSSTSPIRRGPVGTSSCAPTSRSAEGRTRERAR